MKYEVVKTGKLWVIRRIKDKVVIDQWREHEEKLARNRLEMITAMGYNKES